MKNIFALFVFILLITSCKKEEVVEAQKVDLTLTTINWMNDLIIAHPNQEISLKDICLPRAHDAGIYVLNNCLAGNDCNTKTQYLSMKDMLEAGIRVFDVRPSFHDGKFWTYHKTECDGLGCDGVELNTFLQETKNYVDQHKELVILEIGHYCNTTYQDPALLDLFASSLGDRIYKESTPLNGSFMDKPLTEILDDVDFKGKVMLVFRNMNTNDSNPSEGIFASSILPTTGSYSNNPNIDMVIADQLQKFQSFEALGNSRFLFSYTFTLNTDLSIACVVEENATSIESISLEARPRLGPLLDEWIASNIITVDKIPNIISIDFANTEVTKQCIKLSELSLSE